MSTYQDQCYEVDQELIELMKQSESQGFLMDESTFIEKISSVEKTENTMRNKHGFTPVSGRQMPFVGVSAGKTPVSHVSYLGDCSAQMGS